jgi:two-component sensor histidine kinase
MLAQRRSVVQATQDLSLPDRPRPIAGGTVTALSHARAVRARDQASATTTDGGQHLRSLCSRMTAAGGLPDNVTLACMAGPERVPPLILARLGLITKELVGRSLRHGFSTGRGGRISVALETWAVAWQLTIEDSDMTADSGAGMGKVRNLAGGLGGSVHLPRVIGGQRCIVLVPRT